MNDQDQPPADESDWNEDPDEDWGDAPDVDPDGEPTKRFWTLGTVVLLVIVVLLVVFVSAPLFLRRTCGCGSGRTEAMNNAKQLGLALLEFEQDFGKFPDETTVEAVLKETESDLDLSGNSSNALFRQLIAYGIQSEDIFFCKSRNTRRPDNEIGPGQALQPGEVGFSYVAGLDTYQNPGLPLLAAPMKIGTTKFHEEEYEDKAIVLRLDLSAKALPIRSSDQRATWGDGKTLFDPSNERWPKGYEIDLRHPEKRVDE